MIIDEVHALVPNKRGADLAVTLERLAVLTNGDPVRVGLSATCRPPETVARFLVGPGRKCTIVEAPRPDGTSGPIVEVESLLKADEGTHRGLTYRRLLSRIEEATRSARTTVVFANTRPFTEKITHDLRIEMNAGADAVAAHHSSLDAERRRAVEAALKAGELKAVITSTSLELGVDIGQADISILIGLPGSVSRCLQRVGRAGHSVEAQTRGVLLAATPGELAGAVVTAKGAREGRVEPLRPIRAPLDVLCQQLIGMACGGEWSTDSAYALVRKSAPMADLTREDFDACLAFLAGELASPAGAYEPEPGGTPRWTSPRIWKKAGLFGIKNSRVVRWFWSNVGTITSEESVRVRVDGHPIGTIEGVYAERLQPGDRFLLDGRSLEFRRLDGVALEARSTGGGEPALPIWTSDRQGLTSQLALELSRFRAEAERVLADGPSALRSWLAETHDLGPDEVGVLETLIAAQEQLSEIPSEHVLLVEQYPSDDGLGTVHAFHAPLGRPACEALGRATAARLGRKFGRDLNLTVADLGWSITLPGAPRLGLDDLPALLDPTDFETDVLDGLDRGELLARRFRHVAATALMVLRNPEGGRTKVGGLSWVSQRLFPLVTAACPSHPLLKETRREVLEDCLDARAARAWLETKPSPRFRSLDGPSPFASAWIDPGGAEPLRFEPPQEALKRLHERLVAR
jgi:ATP-dependent Lhr-like helicase